MRKLQILYLGACLLIPATSMATSNNPAEILQDSIPVTSAQGEKPLSLYQQGLNYLLGRNGVDKSSKKAASIFKTLAEQNWSSAQHMLGNLYMKGKGVERNDLLAYKWLSLASKSNLRLAESIQSKRAELYERLSQSMSSEDLLSVDHWIAEWEPSIQ